MIHRSRSTLGSIRKIAQISRGKFSDKESGELFHRIVLRDIEKIDFVLGGLLNYIKATTPIRKKNTVHTLIEEVLEKNKVLLEEKKTRLSKKFQKDLPETIISDEQLRYLLNSVLQHAVASMPPNGNIEFLTRSFVLRKEADQDQGFFEKYGRYIEILVSFTQALQKEEEWNLNLMLRLVKEIVLRNRGVMKFETDEKKAETIISLGFPVERRKVVYYRATNA